ncbi:MAG: hypothetical protein II861_03925 [Methanomicrobium sp.]|nr:hypothetical protein [Methanomicrobium sp.]
MDPMVNGMLNGITLSKMRSGRTVAVLLLLTVFSAAVLSGCTTVDKAQVKYDITLKNVHKYWSPAMSSIIGLDITPEYLPLRTGGSSADSDIADAENLRYHWNATGEYGKYVMLHLWDGGSGGRYEELGNDTYTKPNETVWFSCQDYETLAAPERYVIHLTLEDDGRVISERDVGIIRKAMFYYLEDTYYGYNTRVVDTDKIAEQ